MSITIIVIVAIAVIMLISAVTLRFTSMIILDGIIRIIIFRIMAPVTNLCAVSN